MGTDDLMAQSQSKVWVPATLSNKEGTSTQVKDPLRGVKWSSSINGVDVI